jgi:hypothetical protein
MYHCVLGRCLPKLKPMCWGPVQGQARSMPRNLQCSSPLRCRDLTTPRCKSGGHTAPGHNIKSLDSHSEQWSLWIFTWQCLDNSIKDPGTRTRAHIFLKRQQTQKFTVRVFDSIKIHSLIVIIKIIVILG